MNLMWLDIESSGLGDNAAVIEIAAIAYIDGERKHHFQSYVKPHDKCTMDAKAFEVNGIDPKQLSIFPDAETVIQNLLDYIDSFECIFSLSGQNVQFDIKKINQLFCRNQHYGSFLRRFRPGGVCTMKMAKEIFKGKRNKPDGFNLQSLCNYFKVDLKKAHSALPDIEATIDVYEKLLPMVIHKTKELKSVGSYQEMRREYMDSRYVQLNPDGDVYLTRDSMLNDTIRRFIFTELDAIYEENVCNLSN
jgi:DNA polymerase-3 subunit epsilon